MRIEELDITGRRLPPPYMDSGESIFLSSVCGSMPRWSHTPTLESNYHVTVIQAQTLETHLYLFNLQVAPCLCKLICGNIISRGCPDG